MIRAVGRDHVRIPETCSQCRSMLIVRNMLARPRRADGTAPECDHNSGMRTCFQNANMLPELIRRSLPARRVRIFALPFSYQCTQCRSHMRFDLESATLATAQQSYPQTARFSDVLDSMILRPFAEAKECYKGGYG